MKIPTAEQKAIKKVCELGSMWGYGNLISHLQSAWILMLIKNYGVEIETARSVVVNNTPYELEVHLRLLNTGEI
ncbi:MAG: hypothetical protein RBS24_06440 [Bacilli bacterium]|nr:hypothetical protein [Bacilli bacterium]